MQDGFWEKAFSEKQEMWGFEPALSTLLTKDFFLENGIKEVLIPGYGYGRNAQIFIENGMTVTGIEISQTAIDLARRHFGNDTTVYHGSVTEMPFDAQQYDGIFCYALIHLLDEQERAKLVQDCYQQLKPGGYMVFAAITKEARTYGTGEYVSKDRYEIFKGVKMFFYDEVSVKKEFGEYGLFSITDVTESFPFYLIICKK